VASHCSGAQLFRATRPGEDRAKVAVHSLQAPAQHDRVPRVQQLDAAVCIAQHLERLTGHLCALPRGGGEGPARQHLSPVQKCGGSVRVIGGAPQNDTAHPVEKVTWMRGGRRCDPARRHDHEQDRDGCHAASHPSAPDSLPLLLALPAQGCDSGLCSQPTDAHRLRPQGEQQLGCRIVGRLATTHHLQQPLVAEELGLRIGTVRHPTALRPP
jgi:hypothetical protein